MLIIIIKYDESNLCIKILDRFSINFQLLIINVKEIKFKLMCNLYNV